MFKKVVSAETQYEMLNRRSSRLSLALSLLRERIPQLPGIKQRCLLFKLRRLNRFELNLGTANIAMLCVLVAMTSSRLWAAGAFPAAPFISPSSGTYTTGRTVTISDASSGVPIYYTTDGSVPTTASSRYIAPISIPSSPKTETVRAVAVTNGTYGSVTTATYTIAPQLSGPTFSPAQGSYMHPQEITISGTEGGIIHYTTDGTTPTISSEVYSGPILVSVKVTIKAIVAGIVGYSVSGPVAQTYSIIPATPFISPASGTYTTGRTIKISDATPGVVIYYTTDGSLPTGNSALYSAPVPLPNTKTTETIRTIAVANGVGSSVTEATYTVTPALPVEPAPVISPASGTYTTGRVITISDSLTGARVFYTVDGTTPTLSSTPYLGPFNSSSKSGTEVVQAIAFSAGYQPSAISRSQITSSLPAGVIASSLVSSTSSVSVPTNFLGFSHGWNTAGYMMGSTAVGSNPIYQNLVRTLTTYMNGPLVIRVGEGASDSTGTPTPAIVEPFVELAKHVNVKFILGINLASNDLTLAEEQAATFTSTLPSSALMALEIGNEPEGYSSNGVRPSTYSYNDYLAQYKEWSQGVSTASTSNIPIAGPALGGDQWIADVQPDVASLVFKAGVITQHKYVACYYTGNPLPTDILLQPASSTASLYYFQPYAATAHKVGSKFRLDEINSICNGGQPGVSDSFSSALWAIDTMFEDANAGIDGVNWNSDYDGGPYDLFKFDIWNSGHQNLYSLATVRPLYYGLLFFAQAAGNNARLLQTSTLTDSNIKIWSTTDSAGKAHLAIINKEQTTGGNVQITLSGYSSGSVVRLAASSYLATTGVNLGGQTYDNSPDGTLQGSPSAETTYPAAGVWTISVNPMSAVLVNLQP